jgi:EAL domain-containing protein (putative c-di-GMP-specific phosphodiesterase class I)
MAKVALLIGVSKYEFGLNSLPAAVKDVEAMQRVLQHPEMGGFDEIKTLTDSDAHAMQVEIETFFSGRKKEDLLLLYFSGHGIKDDNGKLHLASSTTKKNNNNELITATAVCANFIHDKMNNSRSKRQIIILDCCFSGAFGQYLIAKDDASIDFKGQLGAEGRVVLASSSSTQYSFEQQGDNISIYTRYLVEGIETQTADLDQDGQISVRDLHKYASSQLEKNASSMKPKIIVLKDEGFDIVISGNQKIKPQSIMKELCGINLGQVRLGSGKNIENIDDSNLQASYLSNFLTPYEYFISDLVQHLSKTTLNNSTSQIELVNIVLRIIRVASQADFAFVLCQDDHKDWILKASSDFADNIDRESYINILNSVIFPTISQEFIFNPAHHGILKLHEYKKGIFNAFVIIPLTKQPKLEFMVVCGIPQDSHLLGDIYGRITSSFYQASQKFLLNQTLVEAAIIDDLKKDFGFVSESLYSRRFELFCERLKQMVIFFQPILHLDPNDLCISSWEALARDPESLTVPSDIFKAAELWGPRFTIELDQHFLRVATYSYKQARAKLKQNRSQDIAPLSVNVYPASLMRKAYFETVKKVIKDQLISPRKLVLEISEKTELSQFEDISSGSALKIFKNRLVEYVQQTKIRFAIDDFGVAYASISRLAGLNPSHIKIDREILHSRPNDMIIRFLHELVGADNLDPPDIIVEGVDETTPISLYGLRQIGVNYIQGYIVGEPSSDIYRLSPEKTEYLRNLILGN